MRLEPSYKTKSVKHWTNSSEKRYVRRIKLVLLNPRACLASPPAYASRPNRCASNMTRGGCSRQCNAARKRNNQPANRRYMQQHMRAGENTYGRGCPSSGSPALIASFFALDTHPSTNRASNEIATSTVATSPACKPSPCTSMSMAGCARRLNHKEVRVGLRECGGVWSCLCPACVSAVILATCPHASTHRLEGNALKTQVETHTKGGSTECIERYKRTGLMGDTRSAHPCRTMPAGASGDCATRCVYIIDT